MSRATKRQAFARRRRTAQSCAHNSGLSTVRATERTRVTSIVEYLGAKIHLAYQALKSTGSTAISPRRGLHDAENSFDRELCHDFLPDRVGVKTDDRRRKNCHGAAFDEAKGFHARSLARYLTLRTF